MDSFEFRVEEISSKNPDALFASGFTEALIGYVRLQPYDKPVALYAAEVVISILQAQQGMTEDEAIGWYEFNILGAYMGPETPVFFPLGIMDDDEQEFFVERADGQFKPYKIRLFDEGMGGFEAEWAEN